MSKLEEFVNHNKSRFHEKEPPSSVWEHLERRLESREKKRREYGTLIKVAASVVILIGIGVIFLTKSTTENKPDLNRLGMQEIYYTNTIQSKQNEVKKIKKLEPELYQEFTDDLRLVEEDYNRLRKELPISPNKGKTEDAMIKNLKAQVNVLDQQLKNIRQLNETI